jgi:sporulation protein YabP
MENVKQIKIQHNHIIHIDNREKIEITGVTKVDTFNEDDVLLHTVMGVLNIKGKNMKVNKLNVDTGDMLIEGEVHSLHYLSKDKEKKGSLLKNLFK